MYADRRFVWCQVADVPRLHVARSAGAALLASYLGAILVPLAQITYEKQVGARMALVFVGGAVLGVTLVRLYAVMLVRSTCTGATEPSMRARAVEGLGAAHIALLTPVGTPSLLDLPWEVMWACATDLRPRHIRKLRLVCHRLLAEVGPHLLAASDATCARCGGAFLRLRRLEPRLLINNLKLISVTLKLLYSTVSYDQVSLYDARLHRSVPSDSS